MLSLTANAKAAIKQIATQAGLPAHGGVRIALNPNGDQLEFSLAEEPREHDQVIECVSGARVYVCQSAAPVLSEHELDSSDDDGFSLRRKDD